MIEQSVLRLYLRYTKCHTCLHGLESFVLKFSRIYECDKD